MKKKELKQEIERLQAENERLQAEIEALNSALEAALAAPLRYRPYVGPYVDPYWLRRPAGPNRRRAVNQLKRLAEVVRAS